MVLMNVLPSRDAVDDQFQHTLDVRTDITMMLNSRCQSFQMICWILWIDICIHLFPCAFNECFAFKGCSWRPIPAHPRCANCHQNMIVELARSRAFKWYAEPYISVFALDKDTCTCTLMKILAIKINNSEATRGQQATIKNRKTADLCHIFSVLLLCHIFK